MKKLLIALLFPFSVQAAPFLIMDVSPDADTCTVTGLPTPIVFTVTESEGQCKIDLNALPIGTYTVTATAKNVWEVSPASLPFVFTRPESISTPAGLRLVP